MAIPNGQTMKHPPTDTTKLFVSASVALVCNAVAAIDPSSVLQRCQYVYALLGLPEASIFERKCEAGGGGTLTVARACPRVVHSLIDPLRTQRERMRGGVG